MCCFWRTQGGVDVRAGSPPAWHRQAPRCAQLDGRTDSLIQNGLCCPWQQPTAWAALLVGALYFRSKVQLTPARVSVRALTESD